MSGELNQRRSAVRADDEVSMMGSAIDGLSGLALSLETDCRARRIQAMMWLEYAVDEETVERSTGMNRSDVIWIAHALLQGPQHDGGDMERQWLWARNASVEHGRLARQEDGE